MTTEIEKELFEKYQTKPKIIRAERKKEMKQK